MKRFLTFACIFVFGGGCTNNTGHEQQSEAANHGLFVRNAHSLAYHAKDSSVYLFGGADHREVLSDLWVFTDTTWKALKTNLGPQPRTFAPLIYDHEHNRLVLFGGSKVLFGTTPDPQNLLNDTWEFQNNQWKKLNTSQAPTPRAEAMMVYDESRKSILLFGGYVIQNGEYLKIQDTWEFYDNDWQQVSNAGPSARHGVSMAYDPVDSSVLLFGGSTIDKQYGPAEGETWKWNGTIWEKLIIKQPPGVFNGSMIYDKDKLEFIRFGGWNGNTRINETWAFVNQEWRKIDINQAPSARNHSAMVYDEKNKRVILFGGHDGKRVFGDTWIFTNNKWRKVNHSKPTRRLNNGH